MYTSVNQQITKPTPLAFFTALVVAGLTFVSCGSAEQQYVKKAVKLMDKHGLFAEGPAWEEARQAALAARPATMDEAYEHTRTALKVAGGKHSFIWTTESQQKIAERDKATEPSVKQLEDGIVLITIPEFSGQTKDEQQRYARTVLDAIPEAGTSGTEALNGVVIDLRGNTGGNMYPMIAAVHRFLPDDSILRFKSRKYTMHVTKEFVLRTVGIEEQPRIDCPVALLTDTLTASSGEATLLCFRGLENTRTFGLPTAGYASANSPYPMPDGSKLILTQSCDMARTGELFCDDPIAPDVATDQPMEDALVWLKRH